MRPGRPTYGAFPQGPDPLVELAQCRVAILRVVFLKIVADALQVRCGGRRPADTHHLTSNRRHNGADRCRLLERIVGGSALCRLGAQHFFKPGVHFFFLDEFVPVGIGFAFQHSSTKTRVLIEEPQGSILQEFSRIAFPRMAGELRKPCFLLGCELYFHALKIRENRL